MTDSVLLNQKIKEKGFKKSFIAEKLGITYTGLYFKIMNKTEFKQKEVFVLMNILGLSDEEMRKIFFAQ